MLQRMNATVQCIEVQMAALPRGAYVGAALVIHVAVYGPLMLQH
jgi:hypothetical protein